MKKMKRWASVLLILCMLLAGTPAPAESGGALTGTPTAEQSAEPENTATAEPENTATAEPENTATAEPENTATAEPENTATAEPENTATAEPENTATPIPTDAAEVKTIASFEAVAPEGLFAPQGTPETGLGLPASLNVQFADGAAGEVAAAWQCAAGYDPNAEAGAQFTFAAVLPEGYALHEGVSMPQILVTLTPPLANAMLMAETSGDGWTLSDDGTLTVMDRWGRVESSNIPALQNGSVQRIEVAEGADFYLGSNFSGGITVKAGGCLTNSGRATLSADVTLEGGRLENLGVLTGSVTVKAGGELYNNFTGTLSCDVTVETDGSFKNDGTITGGEISGEVSNGGATFDATISGGTFTGTVNNHDSITGGDFTDATVNDRGGSVTGGVFNGFKLENGVLTITGTVDLNNPDALDPLTIGLDAENIQSIIVAEGATFNAGSTPVDDPVTCKGTITGGTFTASVTCNGTITGGTFAGYTISVIDSDLTLTITGQNFDLTKIDLKSFELEQVVVAAGASVSNADEKNLAGVPFVNYGEISGGTFAEILLYLENNGTITGGTFNCRVNHVNDAIITGGTFNEYLMNLGSVTGATINGDIYNYEGGTITGCTFGESAWVGDNKGTIKVTMTVNGADATFKHGELILSALKAKFSEGDWYAVAGEE